MECNKEEALRAKEIAEKKLALQDYSGAHKLLQRALQLYPNLENTAQMTAVLVVHMAAQTKINGCETDWYGILQVDDVRAEEIMIKKQYKKLALLLHPDKNKLPWAEAAFKLIGEALQVLSDKQQRAIHDARRRPIVSKNTSNRNQNRSQATNKAKNPTAASVSASLTFMTICPACHTRYQYYRVYENQNLLCHQCRTPFVAREFYVGPNNNNGFPWQQQFAQHQQPPQAQAQAQVQQHQQQFQQQFQHQHQHQHQQHQHQHQQQHQHQRFNGSVPSSDTGAAADYITQMMKERQYMDVNLGSKRKRDEEEREMRRMEKEQLKKARADQKAQEAMEKMMRKKREQEEKAAAKEKRKKQRKRVSGSSSEEDDETVDSLDGVSDEEVTNHVVDSGAAPRRSARPRRNVTYRIDVSDDDDDPSSKSKEEVKQNIEEKTNENDAQNGDSVDLQEKQKLADFFKVRIRLSLNLQNTKNTGANASTNATNSANTSGSANGIASDSANGNASANDNANTSANGSANMNGQVAHGKVTMAATNETRASKSADIIMEVSPDDCTASAKEDKDHIKVKSAQNEKLKSPTEDYAVFEEKNKNPTRGKNAFKEKSKSLAEDYSAFDGKDKDLVEEKNALKGKPISLPEDYDAFQEKGKDPVMGKNAVKEKSKSLSEHYASFEVKDSGIAKLRSKRTSSRKYSAVEENDVGRPKVNARSPLKDYSACEEKDKDLGRENSAGRLKSKSPLKNSSILEDKDKDLGRKNSVARLKSASPLKNSSILEEKERISIKLMSESPSKDGSEQYPIQQRTKSPSQDHTAFGEKNLGRRKNSENLMDHYSIEERDAGRGKNAMKLKSKTSPNDYALFEGTGSGMEKNAAKLRSNSSLKDYSVFEEKEYGSGKDMIRDRAKVLSKDYSLHEEKDLGRGKNSIKGKSKPHPELSCAVEKDWGKGKKNTVKEMLRSRGKSTKVEVLNLESDETEEEGSEVELSQESEVEEYGTKESKKKTFYNFKQEREEKNILLGQIWAAYDDIESRPRYYFRVKDIHCRDPFKASITWLELRNMNVQQRALKDRGYHPVCGANFRGSSSQIVNSVDIFSHAVKWEKGPKGTVKIYPGKGEVWAVYRNLRPGNLMKMKASSFTYDVVEVLDNYDEQVGVTVVHLVKLCHYNFVFKRSEVISTISMGELYTFSYQVPAHRLNGYEAPDIKEGFWELDPASLPR